MSELNPPAPPVNAPAPVAPPPPGKRPRWIVLVAVAAIALLVGGVSTAAVFLLSDRFGQARHEYRVTVFLDHDITSEQKAAVEAALAALHPIDAITFESRDQAWARFQEIFKDYPDLVNRTKAADLPESFSLTTAGREFDCGGLTRVRALPGVEQITIVEPARNGRNGAVIACH